MERRSFEKMDKFAEEEELCNDYTIGTEKDGSLIQFNKVEKKWSIGYILKLIAVGVVTVILVYFLGNWILGHFNLLMLEFSKFMKIHPVQGLFLYSIFFIVGMLVFIPPGAFIAVATSTFMNIFGNWQGILIHFMIIYVIEHLANFLSYFIGRNFSRIGENFARKLEYFDVFNNLVVKKGVRITFLMRACLIVPYSVINYVMSITDIGLLDFFIGNHGFIFDFIVSTYIGLSISNLSSIDTKTNDGYSQIIITVLGIAFVSGIIYYVVSLAKNEFNQMIMKEGLKKRLFTDSKYS
jgi:uncharacterized membrane protein YdjX (TVP38/TMEM64 family)